MLIFEALKKKNALHTIVNYKFY